MSAITGHDKICGEICNALGLKNVINLDLKMHLKDVVTINISYWPDSEDVERLIPILKRFELIEVKCETE